MKNTTSRLTRPSLSRLDMLVFLGLDGDLLVSLSGHLPPDVFMSVFLVLNGSFSFTLVDHRAFEWYNRDSRHTRWELLLTILTSWSRDCRLSSLSCAYLLRFELVFIQRISIYRVNFFCESYLEIPMTGRPIHRKAVVTLRVLRPLLLQLAPFHPISV